MKYYITSIEQIKNEETTVTEYGKTEKVDDYNTALSKYYKKLSDVSADLDKNHTYMNISIVNSVGSVLKRDVIGAYQAETPAPEPETPTDTEE